MAVSSDRVVWRTAGTIADLDHAHRIADATERPSVRTPTIRPLNQALTCDTSVRNDLDAADAAVSLGQVLVQGSLKSSLSFLPGG